MTEKENEIWHLIVNSLNNDLSPEEEAMLKAWKEEDASQKQTLLLIENIHNKENEIDESKAEVIYDRIHKSLFDVKKIVHLNFWKYSAIAAVAVILVLSYVLGVRMGKTEPQASITEAFTPYGVNSKIVLPDGTNVYLNAGSNLKYYNSFVEGNRIVSLSGEAYFEVAKDSLHPFIVQANNLKIKVLGTHFNVKAYKGDNSIETTLLEGSVELAFTNSKGKTGSTYRLSPDQQAIYNLNSRSLDVKKVDAQLAAVWKDGTYYFNNESFSSIAARLERNYNMKIKINSKELSEERFFGFFVNTKNIFQLLDIMKSYSKFDYKLAGDSIIILKND